MESALDPCTWASKEPLYKPLLPAPPAPRAHQADLPMTIDGDAETETASSAEERPGQLEAETKRPQPERINGIRRAVS
jgi:hypothetical protein